MPSKPLNGVFQRIRKLAAVHTLREASDRDLLARFIGDEDEAAFTLLVERHGPMVLGLCRRVLRHGDDADDACQATFLVLARKAAALRKSESLGSWLHSVAYRVANNLRRQHARRQRRELAHPRSAAQVDDGDITWRELRGVLDEELERLPQRYRAPLVLCYLEGKTRDEAAQQLGSSPGALHGLLERGRKLLRDRLTKRGLTLSAALFGAALGETAAQAALAPALVVVSTQAALALTRDHTVAQGLIAPHILSLVQEATKVMFMTKMKIGAALVVAAGVLTAWVGGALQSVSLAQEGAKPKAAALATQKTESDEEYIRRLSKDLRGIEPSPAEIHFFIANKDANRRQKIIDLFIQERQAKEKAQGTADRSVWIELHTDLVKAMDRPLVLKREHLAVVQDLTIHLARPARFTIFQEDFYKAVVNASKDKKDVAGITQKYLEQLLDYVKAHPKNEDVPDAMLQIGLVYRSLGKTVEADAWRNKLRKEHPKSSAAKTAQSSPPPTVQFLREVLAPQSDELILRADLTISDADLLRRNVNVLAPDSPVAPIINQLAPKKIEEKK